MKDQLQAMMTNLLEIRSFAYDVLRIFFQQEPNLQLLKELEKGHYMKDFPFSDDHYLIQEGVKNILAFFEINEPEKIFEQLHWDYTRMFIGPYELPAPLWESAYLNKDGLLFQKETLMVRQEYLKYNLLPAQFGQEADDHLGLELDFIYQLNQVAMEAIKQGDIAKATEILTDQAKFIEQHLLKWVPLLKEKIITHAKFDFYKGMVKILHGFLEIDQSALEEVVTIKQ
jgi:TorA maturation chaperone TorD